MSALTCDKAPHDDRMGGYLHDENDDSPYDVDGVAYCGRCHVAIASHAASSATPTPGPTHNTLMEEIAATASASYWAARLASSHQEVERLKAVIERDRTRFGIWIERLRAETRSRWGMATSRGSYEWDDEAYRKEFGAALTAFEKALDRVFEEVHVRDFTDSPTTDKGVQEARRALTTEPR